jgi:hypothetical protein
VDYAPVLEPRTHLRLTFFDHDPRRDVLAGTISFRIAPHRFLTRLAVTTETRSFHLDLRPHRHATYGAGSSEHPVFDWDWMEASEEASARRALQSQQQADFLFPCSKKGLRHCSKKGLLSYVDGICCCLQQEEPQRFWQAGRLELEKRLRRLLVNSQTSRRCG